MIIGIGTDIVDIRRIEKLLADKGERFLERIFNPEELTEKPDAAAHYAKRYAAKEAVAKALGNGIGQLNFKHIKILNRPSGQPYAVIENRLEKIHLSMSDEYPYAVAYAVVEQG